jgi:hypothetical protein
MLGTLTRPSGHETAYAESAQQGLARGGDVGYLPYGVRNDDILALALIAWVGRR